MVPSAPKGWGGMVLPAGGGLLDGWGGMVGVLGVWSVNVTRVHARKASHPPTAMAHGGRFDTLAGLLAASPPRVRLLGCMRMAAAVGGAGHPASGARPQAAANRRGADVECGS